MISKPPFFSIILLSSFALNMYTEQRDDDAWRKYAFEYVYKNNVWKNDAAVSSGPGSTLQTTKELQLLLPAVLKAIDTRTILDAGCGDLTWLKEVSLDIEHYFGFDIVDHVIESHKRNHASENRTFICRDVTHEDLPKVDVIFCRDCLAHLSFKDVKLALNNFKRSGTTYLLATSYFSAQNKNDIRSGNFHFVNLQAPPFNLPEPLMTFDELSAEKDMASRRKRLCLWRLEDIPAYNDTPTKQQTLKTPSTKTKLVDTADSTLEFVRKISESIMKDMER